MKIIGLTGAIGSGKSTVAQMLKEKGAVVIDADSLAKDAIKCCSEPWEQIVHRYGEGILDERREIDRGKLASTIFNNPDELAFVNSIVHPVVQKEIERTIEELKRKRPDLKAVVLDVPLLIEVGWHKRTDFTIIVRSDYETRLNRLIAKGYSTEDAHQRIETQKLKEKLEVHANIIIDNNSTIKELKDAVEMVWKDIA
jgi:dephospho-CoA kinase